MGRGIRGSVQCSEAVFSIEDFGGVWKSENREERKENREERSTKLEVKGEVGDDDG